MGLEPHTKQGERQDLGGLEGDVHNQMASRVAHALRHYGADLLEHYGYHVPFK